MENRAKASSDDEINDEDGEAWKTWEIRKELGLIAHNEDEVVQRFVHLRRSSRKLNQRS